MGHSELFLLLPRYKEVTGQPGYISSIDIMPEAEIKRVIKTLDEICLYIENENCEGYYDAENVTAFLYPIEVAEDCYPNVITRMRMIMNKWGENWRTQKEQKDTESYMYFCLPIKDDTLCEITERKIVSEDNNSFLLVNLNAFPCASDIICVKRGQTEIRLDVRMADVRGISLWFATNRKPQRGFNPNPKHGENGKGAHPSNKGNKVSILMCSKEEAEQMLHKAVGTDLRTLYYFDRKYNQYIEFKCECENTYHAFHLDAEDEKRVPEPVKHMIERLS